MVADIFEPFVLEEDEDLLPGAHPALDDEGDEEGGDDSELGEDGEYDIQEDGDDDDEDYS